jgi:hypothetical protein
MFYYFVLDSLGVEKVGERIENYLMQLSFNYLVSSAELAREAGISMGIPSSSVAFDFPKRFLYPTQTGM